ncbi:Arm DNA-binding domain-containing protein, partial [Anaerotruncus colihominis]|uniref:Arm DNA-binding domain-containing protein n=1 Tax=Anaerotruncus colihominis TaxID=169435 RepID=UPI0034E5C325
KGERKLKKKRGFPRKKDADAFEEEFLRKGSQSCDMTFASMLELYLEDMRPRLKENTMKTKESIIESKITPFIKSPHSKQRRFIPAYLQKKFVNSRRLACVF